MPNSAVVTFTDPDEFYAAVRNAQVDGVVTAPADPHSIFSFVMRGLVPRIQAFPFGCFPSLRRQAGPRLHVALDRRSNFSPLPRDGERAG